MAFLQESLETKENNLLEKERQLKTFAASLSELLREKSQEGKIEVLKEQIYLWRRQALALKRSQRHLEKIDSLIEATKSNTSSNLSISIRDCGALLYDQQEFTELAFTLIAEAEQISFDLDLE